MVRPGTSLSIAIVTALLSVAVGSDAQAQQAAMERIKRSGTITVCADPDRLPYSSQKLSPAGFDIDVSQEIAKELGFKLAYTWHSTHRGTKIVRQLAEAGCDFFPGFPVDGSFEENNFKVILSKPFYSSGFATLTRADSAETILQDSKTKGVGVMMGTLPDFKLFNRGYERKLFRNTAEMIDALKHKEIDAAVVPALEGGWEVKASGDTSLKVLANTEKDFVFPIAFGFAKADKDLRDLVNSAIDKLESDGRLAAIFEKYGVVKLAGTGGGEPPKSKEELEKEDAGKDDDGPPSKDKKSDLNKARPVFAETPTSVLSTLASIFISSAVAADGEKPATAPGEIAKDEHGIPLSRDDMVDPKIVEDFPADPKSVDDGRKLYKQACYKCHGNYGVSGGTIPDLRIYAGKYDHYEMFGVIQAGRLDRGMPAWNDYLTADEIKKIVVYVKALPKK